MEPQQLQGHEVAMQRIRCLAEEHFDDFILIVGKDKDMWSFYNKGTSAYGMMAKVSQQIYQSWVHGEK